MFECRFTLRPSRGMSRSPYPSSRSWWRSFAGNIYSSVQAVLLVPYSPLSAKNLEYPPESSPFGRFPVPGCGWRSKGRQNRTAWLHSFWASYSAARSFNFRFGATRPNVGEGASFQSNSPRQFSFHPCCAAPVRLSTASLKRLPCRYLVRAFTGFGPAVALADLGSGLSCIQGPLGAISFRVWHRCYASLGFRRSWPVCLPYAADSQPHIPAEHGLPPPFVATLRMSRRAGWARWAS
jgi:hypothetical protein